MSDIVLGSATQQNLLALQTIATQMNTTQNALASGLKVSSAVDNAVAFFQSQSLDNRANDLSTRKNNIDQGISSLTTAAQGIQSAISILQQLQGIAESAKTETTAQQAAAAKQFNTLSVQLNQLLDDSSYQGLNLVNSSTSNLTLQFSQSTTSTLKVVGQNLLMSMLLTAAAVKASKMASALAGFKFSQAVSAGKSSAFDKIFNSIAGAINTAQAAAGTLGGNVTFLNTRLNFTSSYLTTLQGGANSLTVADVNVESTNLVTLQTRQQLAIQSLSIATQAEQSVLRLFH